MNDRGTPQTSPAMQALPDGEAELSLVVRLPWEDVARLGQEAGRLAAQLQRPVTLDEAVGHRLRSVRPTATHARAAVEQTAAAASSSSGAAAVTSSASVASLPRISGTA
ncbi:hypothetical protein AB0F77_13420 [Streptomyces sp. NPDC026672]|uniref:hypothetical protein n=1 Tax=unclassified Streptomyces TaxID=2593676 RepID=UPI0033CB3956